MNDHYAIISPEQTTRLETQLRHVPRHCRACESAYWKLKPYRTRWQKFCLRMTKVLQIHNHYDLRWVNHPLRFRIYIWFRRQAKA